MSKTYLVACLLTLVLAIAYVEVRRPDVATAPEASSPDLDPIESRLDRIEKRLERLESAPARLPDPIVAPPSGEPGEMPPAAASEQTRRSDRAKAFLEKLKSGPVTVEEISSLWNYLSGSGLEKEAIAAFRELVQKNPKDPDAWYGLGTAITSLFLAGNVGQADIAMLSMQADRAFDQALALDDRHFAARYSKAVSLTFWPSFLGKGPESIRNFEILVEQDGGNSSNRMMESVYLNLGNEYLKMGNVKKAREAFESGLGVFSESEEIRSALEAMER